jgi:hypothetical protein
LLIKNYIKQIVFITIQLANFFPVTLPDNFLAGEIIRSRKNFDILNNQGLFIVNIFRYIKAITKKKNILPIACQ